MYTDIETKTDPRTAFTNPFPDPLIVIFLYCFVMLRLYIPLFKHTGMPAKA